MFTGIVKSIEPILKISQEQTTLYLTVKRPSYLQKVQVDDSVAINGVCLTLIHLDENSLTFGIFPETLKCTNLGHLKIGDFVNVEPALCMGDSMGGHNVQGHIDTTAQICKMEFDGQALNVTFSLPSDLAILNIKKGFIALDGISLTLTEVSPQTFSVMLITHTQQHTIAQYWQQGDRVNMEIDIHTKTIMHLLKNMEINR